MNNIAFQFITPPRLNEGVIRREGLLKLCDTAVTKPLILINAFAGYGKTVLLRMYSKQITGNWCWLTVPSDISSPAFFVKYLIYSAREKHPLFGENIIDYIDSYSGKTDETTVRELVTVFVNEIIRSFEDSITIIIDDFQNLENGINKQWVSFFFDECFKAIPQNLKFVISTRENPSFKMARLEAKRLCLNISTNDLCFDLNEISILLNTVYSKQNPGLCKLILEKSGGWITAIHMLMQYPDNLQSNDTKISENLYNYIAEDIFSDVDAELKSFLIKTAFLSSFTEEFADKLIGAENSITYIKKLISKNIFLEFSQSEKGAFYFYQKLFSDFLKRYTYQHCATDEINADFLKIAECYIQISEPEEALWFLLKGGDNMTFRKILKDIIPAKFDNYDYFTIGQLLEMAGNLCNDDPDLAYFRFKYYIKTSDLGKISKTDLDLLCETESGEFTRSILLKSEYMILTGDLNSSLELLKSHKDKFTTIEFKKEYIALIAKTYYRLGGKYYDTLIEFSEEAFTFFEEYNIKNEKLELLNYMAHISSDRWDFLTAKNYYEASINLEHNIRKLFNCFSNLIELYSDQGYFDKAWEYIQKCEKVYSNVPSLNFQRQLIRSRQKFFSNLGDYKAALNEWNKLSKNCSDMGNKYFSKIYYLTYCDIYYAMNDKTKAEEYFRISEQYLISDEYIDILGNFMNNYYCTTDTLSAKTEESIIKMLNYHTENDIKFVIPQMQFHISKIHLEKEMYVSAENYLRLSLNKYEEKNQTFFLETELLLSRKLFDFAISGNIQKKLIGDVLSAIQNKLYLDFISNEFMEELKLRIFRLTDICFLPFGSTEFYQRGEPVPEDKWIRKKSKVLLAYLMSDPERIHTKDEIIDMFFGDMPVDKADTAYHSTLYNIRTALKIYDIKTDKPKRSKDKTYDYNPQYILYEDKTIRLNHDFYYESANIEFEKLFSKSRLTSISAGEKREFISKAIEIYKGDFMPGYYDSWCEELRTKYKNNFIILCEEIINTLEDNAKYEEVIKYCELLLNEDKLNDSAHISIINAYSKLGNLNMAKNRSRLMLKIYDEELGEKPQPKTLENINSILS